MVYDVVVAFSRHFFATAADESHPKNTNSINGNAATSIEETYFLALPTELQPRSLLRSSRAGGARTHDTGVSDHVVPSAFAAFRLTDLS